MIPGATVNWPRVAAASTVPLPVALGLAWLLWRKNYVLFGNVAGSALLFLATITFAAMEFAEAVNFRVLCQGANLECPLSDPSDFVRIATYGVVGFAQVGVLYWLSLVVEERRRSREFAPRWR